MKALIPNTLTALNLFCGCIAVISLIAGEYWLAIILVLIAALADFLDGFVARALGVSSELGKQLDSLADMISFGFVPGTIMFIALSRATESTHCLNTITDSNYLPFIGFLITVFSGVRLAKFNIDTRQSTSFIGLPTPANTLFFLSFPLIWEFGSSIKMMESLFYNKSFLIIITLLFSYLLVAEIPLIALKFKSLKLKENLFRYILISLALIMILIFKQLSLLFLIPLYILISILENLFKK